MEQKKIDIVSLPFIKLEDVEMLFDRLEAQDSQKAGGNSSAYIFEDYVVLKTRNIPLGNVSEGIGQTPYDNVIKKLHDLKNQGVNVVPILGYICNQMTDFGREAFGRGFIFQPRATGSEMWQRDRMPNPYRDITQKECDYLFERASTLAAAPQKHFDKWVSDYKKITDAGIQIDPSKKENFFYDEKLGFSFIDMNFEGEPIFGKNDSREFIIYCLLPCVGKGILGRSIEDFPESERERFVKFENDNREIFSKCVRALINAGVKAEEIRNAYDGRIVGVEQAKLDSLLQEIEDEAQI